LTLSLRDGGTPNEHARTEPDPINRRVPSGDTQFLVEPNSLAHLILYLGDDDWVPIGEVNSHARRFESEIVPRKALFLETVRKLAEARCIQIGEVDRHDLRRPRTTDFMEWPGSLDDRMARLADIYRPEAEDEMSWYWGCRLYLTGAGERVLATLPEPDDRFFG
jgi:hypothetical protein